MNCAKERFIRNKLNELEKHHEYSVATDTVRCWLDEYNEAVEKSTRISNPDFYYSNDELEEEDEDFKPGLFSKQQPTGDEFD